VYIHYNLCTKNSHMTIQKYGSPEFHHTEVTLYLKAVIKWNIILNSEIRHLSQKFILDHLLCTVTLPYIVRFAVVSQLG